MMQGTADREEQISRTTTLPASVWDDIDVIAAQEHRTKTATIELLIRGAIDVYFGRTHVDSIPHPE